MNERGVSAAELAEVIRLPVEQIEAFQDGTDDPDPDAAYLIARALDGSYRAELAFDRLRRRKTVPLAGDGAAQLGIKPQWPRDGAGVMDGGRVQ
jgi:hypothetical protein